VSDKSADKSCVSGSDKRAALLQLTASYSCGKLNGRHADILATILAKMSVSVSIPWNSSYTAQRHAVKSQGCLLRDGGQQAMAAAVATLVVAEVGDRSLY